MRIGFVGEVDAQAEETDLLLCGFCKEEAVSYEQELKGESEFFQGVAKRSKEGRNVVVCGCVTDTRGQKRKSAVVAEKGKLLGVSDCLYGIDGEYSAGAELRIYPTAIGKIGVAVAEDLFFFEGMRALALCGSDFIVCPFQTLDGELPSVLLRAAAFEYGLPILLCAKGYSMLADPKGELVFSSPQSPVYFDYTLRKEYHLLSRRQRRSFPAIK